MKNRAKGFSRPNRIDVREQFAPSFDPRCDPRREPEAFDSTLVPKSRHFTPTSGTYPVAQELPEESASLWAACAEPYSTFARAVTSQFAEDALRLVRLKPQAEVLDSGAGTGSFSIAVAKQGARVIATDFCEEMLGQLESECTATNTWGIKSLKMNGQRLEFGDERFDLTASLFGLMYFPDYERGLREMYRVTKPGGRALIACWSPPEHLETTQLLRRAATRLQLELPLSLGAPPWTPLSSATGMRDKLLHAGFDHAHVISVRHLWTAECAEELSQLLTTITPSSAALLSPLSGSQRQIFKNSLRDDLRTRQGAGPFALTCEALIGVASKG